MPVLSERGLAWTVWLSPTRHLFVHEHFQMRGFVLEQQAPKSASLVYTALKAHLRPNNAKAV